MNKLEFEYSILLLTSSFLASILCEPSAGCGKPLPDNVVPGISSNMAIEVLDPQFGNVPRTFRLFVPSSYDNSVSLPLVVDYHGFHENGQVQESLSRFIEVAETDPQPFIVASADGMADGAEGGAWNCSRTNGPLGPPCDTDRATYGTVACYDSCPSCDSSNSCDWTPCYDDIAFTRSLVEYIENNFCVDDAQVHQTGFSNGGMFSYYMISQLDDVFASIAPVSGSPLIGFGELPTRGIHLIDMHGLNDDILPYDADHAVGVGPHHSVYTWDRYYYEAKPDVIKKWTRGFGCTEGPEVYETPMDGVNSFSCNIWKGCYSGKTEIVSCTGDHGHGYPFADAVEASRIIWTFMKNHPKQ